MEFIENHTSAVDCVLCSLLQDPDQMKVLIIAKSKSCYCVMNKFPYAHGHLMVVPNRHEKDWTQLTKEELLDLNETTQKAMRVLREAFKPDGFNLGVNLGRAAGAGIEGHVHQHIVPRWVGDYNFMPLFSETKVISEHLSTTHKRISEVWKKV